jgi:hypothetical protein
MKTCGKCKKQKTDGAFHKDRSRKDGRATVCRICRRAIAKAWRDRTGYYKRRYRENRDSERERILKRKYGIGFKEYHQMLDAQGGKCAICRRPGPTDRMLNVDHDHATGHVRGILCNNCNRMLGHAKDDTSILSAGIEYLESFRRWLRSLSKRSAGQ